MATDSIEDREQTRFITVHYSVLTDCDPDYEHIPKLAKRFLELKEVAPQTAWALKSVRGELPPPKSNWMIN